MGIETMLDSVLNQLMKTTAIERQQLKSYEFQNDMPVAAYDTSLTQERKTPVLNNYFFKNKNIYVSKHNRYAPYPVHTHTFLEINYVLRGEVVEGREIHLKTGDLLLLDVGCKHSIGYLGTNDLLINILFRDRDINIDLLNDLRKNQSVLYEFLLNRKIGIGNTEKYIYFPQTKGREISETLDRIIEEYYLQKNYGDSIISSYLSILIAQMVRNYRVDDHNIGKSLSKRQIIVIEILKDINDNYATVKLSDEAVKYGYNKNYLSNIFKSIVEDTFSNIVNKQRIINAHILLDTTALPVTEVMKKVGIKNKTFFYRKYEERYKASPGKKR